MTKHYVVLEFEIDDETHTADRMPWHVLLAGAVNVTNWKDITPEAVDKFSAIKGFNDVTSDHEFDSVEEAVDALYAAAQQGDDVPEEIVAFQPFEYYNAKELLSEAQSASESSVYALTEFLQIDRTDWA